MKTDRDRNHKVRVKHIFLNGLMKMFHLLFEMFSPERLEKR